MVFLYCLTIYALLTAYVCSAAEVRGRGVWPSMSYKVEARRGVVPRCGGDVRPMCVTDVCGRGVWPRGVAKLKPCDQGVGPRCGAEVCGVEVCCQGVAKVCCRGVWPRCAAEGCVVEVCSVAAGYVFTSLAALCQQVAAVRDPPTEQGSLFQRCSPEPRILASRPVCPISILLAAYIV